MAMRASTFSAESVYLRSRGVPAAADNSASTSRFLSSLVFKWYNLHFSIVAAHPYDAGNALRDINTQYWVASFLNGPEAFANFRRSGFPVLTPNPYPGKDISSDFIRKLTYPDTELGINKMNVDEAIARQGGNQLDTRVWWDKE